MTRARDLADSADKDIAGTLTLDGLTVDGDVGIGTSSPSNQLHVDGTSDQLRLSDGVNGFDIRAGGSLIIKDDGTERMRIDASGNVGIGRTPSAFNTSYVGLQIGGTGGNSITLAGNDASIGTGYYLSALGTYAYDNSSATASMLNMYNREFVFKTAASGIAGNTITWSEVMRIDAGGNLLVGTPSLGNADVGVEARANGTLTTTADSQTALFVKRIGSGSNDEGELARFQNADGTVGSIGYESAGTYIDGEANHSGLSFQAPNITPRYNGSITDDTVHLGSTSNRFKDLYLSSSIKITGSGDKSISLTSGTSSTSVINMGDADDIDAGQIVYDNANNSMQVKTNGSEAMRITSAGDLLVGTTSTGVESSSSQTGSTRYSSGIIANGVNNNVCAVFNRQSTNGEIVRFRKDGAPVGSIGTNSLDRPYIAGQSGVVFFTSALLPAASTGEQIDNNKDLGAATVRWDDVYATNGTIQTSDRNEKQDIAELTDAEITAAKAISKLFKTFKWNDSVAEKGDAARTHTGVIAQDVEQAMTDAGLDVGNYAFFISTTWWETQTEVPAVEADEENGVEAQEAYTRTDTYETVEEAPEGATERNRKGIRYPELLSFIGATTEQRLASIESRLDALEAE